MVKNSIKRNIISISFFIIFIVIVLNGTLLFFINRERKELYEKSEINYVRIKLKPSLDIIKEFMKDYNKKNMLIKNLDEENAGVLILNSNGNKFFSYKSMGYENDSLDESLYMDNSFNKNHENLYKIAFPIVVGGKQTGNAIFFLNRSEVFSERLKNNNIIYIIIFTEAAVVFSLLLFLYFILRKKIINPIYDLKKAVNRINKGDFNFNISYGKGELGEFSGAFELMRDEINKNISLQKDMEDNRKSLIAAISHDIRTPVATINAYIEAINYEAFDDKKLKKYLNVIYKKCGELKKLTEDLFTHSQVEAEKLSILKEQVYFSEFFKTLLEPVAIEFNSSNVEIEVKTLVPDIIINMDSRRVGQVFINILENSRKYKKENGKINIYFKEDKRKVEVLIEDNGIGISPSDMPFIFNKFYRGEKSRNKAYGGAGLGLSICKDIVEAHGGSIWIESLEGEGTRVFFTININ